MTIIIFYDISVGMKEILQRGETSVDKSRQDLTSKVRKVDESSGQRRMSMAERMAYVDDLSEARAQGQWVIGGLVYEATTK